MIPFDPADREEFRLRSPVAFATSFRCPGRLYFGEEELLAPESLGRTAILARRAGLDVEAVELQGGHDSAFPEAVALFRAFFGRRRPAQAWRASLMRPFFELKSNTYCSPQTLNGPMSRRMLLKDGRRHHGNRPTPPRSNQAARRQAHRGRMITRRAAFPGQ